MGKPVVYHNPHGERVDKFQDGQDVYKMTQSCEELSEELSRLSRRTSSMREAAADFLHLHCHTSNERSSDALVAEAVLSAVGEDSR